MPDAAPATEATTPVVPSTPAVATPPVTIEGPEARLQAIKDRLKAADKPAEATGEAKPAGDKPPEVVPDAKKVLGELASTQRKLREAEGKLKTSEADATDAALARELRDLWKKSPDDKLAALAKLSGNDATDELAALVALFYENEGTAADGKAAAPSGELKTLTELVTSLKTELSELRAEGKTKVEAQTKEQLDRQAAASLDYISKGIDARKAKFEISSRPENIVEAASLVEAAIPAIAKREKISLEPNSLTAAIADRLIDLALEEVEKEYETLGKRFSKPTAAPVNFLEKPAYNRPLSRPGLNFKRLGADGKVPTFDQVLQHAREKYAQGGSK